MLRKLFPKNIDTQGRIFRLLLACGLLGYAFYTKSFIAFFFALFVVFEVSMSWCAVLHLFGKKSCSINKKK